MGFAITGESIDGSTSAGAEVDIMRGELHISGAVGRHRDHRRA